MADPEGLPLSNISSTSLEVADQAAKATDVNEPLYIVYKRRWLILLVACLNILVNNMGWLTFAPVATYTAQYYDISIQSVNWLSTIYVALFIPGALLAAWLSHRHDTYALLATGVTLNAVGLSVRTFSNLVPVPGRTSAYAILMVGQSLAALAQPFLLSLTTPLAALWFPSRERAMANMLMSVSNPVGAAAASLVGPALVTKNQLAGLRLLLVVVTVPSVLGALLVWAVPRKPPSAPSRSALIAEESHQGEGSILHRLRDLASNFSYLTLVTVFSIAVGLFNCLMTLLEQIVHPYGYTADDAGLLGAIFIGCGLLGAGLGAWWVGRWQRYKLLLCICLTVATAATINVALAAQQREGLVYLAASLAVLGLASFPCLATALELGAEVSYPVPEGICSSLMYVGSQAITLVLIPICDGPLTRGPERDMRGATYLFAVLMGVATLVMYTWRGECKRSGEDQGGNDTPLLQGQSLQLAVDVGPVGG